MHEAPGQSRAVQIACVPDLVCSPRCGPHCLDTLKPASSLIYYSHLPAGTQDPLFKSEYIIKGIVPLLEGGFGLNVTVNSGPWNHTVPPSVAQAGMQWFQDCPSRAMAPSPMPSG